MTGATEELKPAERLEAALARLLRYKSALQAWSTAETVAATTTGSGSLDAYAQEGTVDEEKLDETLGEAGL